MNLFQILSLLIFMINIQSIISSETNQGFLTMKYAEDPINPSSNKMGNSITNITSNQLLNIQKKKIYHKDNLNSLPTNRPSNDQITLSNFYQINNQTNNSSNSSTPSTRKPIECYKSLKEWKKDQTMRLNTIMNYIQKQNGNSIIFEWRLQKSLYNSFWSLLPDGLQLYILRQKEFTILNVFQESRKETCCFSNVYYDCAYPPKNATLFYG